MGFQIVSVVNDCPELASLQQACLDCLMIDTSRGSSQCRRCLNINKQLSEAIKESRRYHLGFSRKIIIEVELEGEGPNNIFHHIELTP